MCGTPGIANERKVEEDIFLVLRSGQLSVRTGRDGGLFFKTEYPKVFSHFNLMWKLHSHTEMPTYLLSAMS